MSELRCHDRMAALQVGMASIIPIEFLPLLTPADAEFRTCGLPEVDLDFLKVSTSFPGLGGNRVNIWIALTTCMQGIRDLCDFAVFHQFLYSPINFHRMPIFN